MKNRKKLRVLIAAAGSGGHLFPAQQLKKLLGSSAEVLFAGSGLASNPFFAKETIAFQEISASPLKKGFFSKTCLGLWQSLRLFKRFKPDVVVGFGSFHTFPILAAAVLLRKKIVLFEPNAALGKVNRLIFPFSKKIAGQFLLPVKENKRALVPFLPWENREKRALTKKEALAYFGLDTNKKTILVFGGSQGALFFNEKVAEAIDLLGQKRGDLQVIHFAGKKGKASYVIPSCVKEFEPDMEMAYKAADIAVSRAGAGTIGELIHFAVAALLIPFPFATEEHQKKNAEFLAGDLQGAKMVEQKEATIERIGKEIEHLLEYQEVYQRILGAVLHKRENRVDFSKIIQEVAE